jgi:hypothetical protein
MAVVVHGVLLGMTKEQYDQLRDEVGWLERAPDGGIVHLTWWEDGDCHTTDAWESEAAFEAFGQDRLGPAMAKLGLDVEVQPTFYPAHEVYAPQSAKLI